MRDVFTKTVNSDLVSVHDGSFTEVKAVSDGWADIIIIAQVSLIPRSIIQVLMAYFLGLSLVPS